MATVIKDRKKACTREFIIIIVIGALAFAYLGFQLGATYLWLTPGMEKLYDPNKPGLIDAFTYLSDHIKAEPFGLWPIEKTGVELAFLAWVILFAICYRVYRNRYNSMYSDVHGRSKFNDNIKEFLINFVLDPKIVNRSKPNIVHYVIYALRSCLISAAIGIPTMKILESKGIMWVTYPRLILVAATLFVIGSLYATFGKHTKKVENIKKVTTKKLRYGIQKKITPIRRILCCMTPNTVKVKDFEECMDNSFIQSQEVRLSLNTRWMGRTLSNVIFGVPGTGKTFFLIKPNILQANSSYVITDPKGELLRDCGGYLKKKGYNIKVLNLKDLTHTMRYNPLYYIKKQEDIPKIVNMILSNIDGPDGQKSNEDGSFWNQATKLIFYAVVAYLIEVYPDENEFLEDGTANPHWKGHVNLINVINMLRMSSVSEDGSESISEVDALFAELAEQDRNSYAVRNYQSFKTNSGRTALNVLITALAKLNLFDNDSFQNVTYKDEMELERVSTEKTALFVILPVNDVTFNFLSSVLFTQLLKILYDQGDANGGRVKIPVQFMLDEMANLGRIPSLNRILSTCRSYCISLTMVFQTLSQLKNYDKDDYNTLLSAVDSLIYLGSTEKDLLKYLSERLGSETVNTHSSGVSGKSGGSDNRQMTKHDLLSPADIEMMSNADCLIFVRAQYPFFTPKYNPLSHKNYKYLGNSGMKEALIYDESSLETYYDEQSIKNSFVKVYSNPEHTVPRLLDKYKDANGNPTPLPIENFSLWLSQKAAKMTNGEAKSWKELMISNIVEQGPAASPTQTEQKEQNYGQAQASSTFQIPTEEQVEDFYPVTTSDKKDIQRKIDEITNREFVNISENQFKILMSIMEECPEEELVAWCLKNLSLKSGFSPSYEFVPETDFLINDGNDENPEMFTEGQMEGFEDVSGDDVQQVEDSPAEDTGYIPEEDLGLDSISEDEEDLPFK